MANGEGNSEGFRGFEIIFFAIAFTSSFILLEVPVPRMKRSA